MRGFTWSKETLEMALRFRLAFGGSGYEFFREQIPMFPAPRTLSSRLENLRFEPNGILGELVDMMKLKCETMSELEKDVGILFDEMKIEAGVEYEPALRKWIGEVTLPDHEGVATHALVFMIAGISSNPRFKQTVAYYFSGDKTNGMVYGPIIGDILQAMKFVGLKVNFVSSDMGPPNRAFWN